MLLSQYLSARKLGKSSFQRWAYELQNAYAKGSGNYLYIYINTLFRHDKKLALGFVKDLDSFGISVSTHSGQFLSLQHLDPAVPVYKKYRDPDSILRQLPIEKYRILVSYVDNFVGMDWDVNYRPPKGGFSRVLKLIYKDGVRLDLDYLAISDNAEPSISHSIGYGHYGVAKRIFPLRLNKNTTPRLYRAKQNAVKQVIIYSNELDSVLNSGVLALSVLPSAAFPVVSFVRPATAVGPSVRRRSLSLDPKGVGNKGIGINNLKRSESVNVDPRGVGNKGVKANDSKGSGSNKNLIETKKASLPGAVTDSKSAALVGKNAKLADAAAAHPDTIFHRNMPGGGIKEVAAKGELEAGAGTGLGGGDSVRAFFGPANANATVSSIEFTTPIRGGVDKTPYFPYFGNWTANNGTWIKPDLKDYGLPINIRKIVYKNGAIARPLGNGKFQYTPPNGPARVIKASELPDI
ncbi:MAG: hypothetical protein COA75_06830 [Cellvibrionales bacterium]|nr:MAG: hypothetical protein COA75_06830 [Cellvibrionales bacterium]